LNWILKSFWFKSLKIRKLDFQNNLNSILNFPNHVLVYFIYLWFKAFGLNLNIKMKFQISGFEKFPKVNLNLFYFEFNSNFAWKCLNVFALNEKFLNQFKYNLSIFSPARSNLGPNIPCCPTCCLRKFSASTQLASHPTHHSTRPPPPFLSSQAHQSI
jgi:hypothetical protein